MNEQKTKIYDDSIHHVEEIDAKPVITGWNSHGIERTTKQVLRNGQERIVKEITDITPNLMAGQII